MEVPRKICIAIPVFNVVFQGAIFEMSGVFTVNAKYLFRVISDGLFIFVTNRVLWFLLWAFVTGFVNFDIVLLGPG